MSTLHCALENGADLYVNERQKIRRYLARSTEERRRRRKNKKKNAKSRKKKKKNAKSRLFFLLNLRYYSNVIHSSDWKSAIEHDGRVLKA